MGFFFWSVENILELESCDDFTTVNILKKKKIESYTLNG